jgi:hypothetical protein
MKKKRLKKAVTEAQPLSKAGQSPEALRRRVLLQLAATCLLISILVAGLAVWVWYPRSLTESERAGLIECEKIRLALADDNLEMAGRSARMLRVSYPQLPISKLAAALEKCDSLESARQTFKKMSQQALTLVRGVDGYFIAECPPGFNCPFNCSPCRMAEFGPWVQISPDLRNPFMGKKSPQCGVLRPTR